jgi:hypothetical protein
MAAGSQMEPQSSGAWQQMARQATQGVNVGGVNQPGVYSGPMNTPQGVQQGIQNYLAQLLGRTPR